MTKTQVQKMVKYTAHVNSKIPRNGSGTMDARAFEKLAKKLVTQNASVLKRLAEDR